MSVARPLELELALPVDPPAEDRRLFYDFSGRVVTEVLRDALPQVISVDLASSDRRVSVALDGPHGPYALSFERRRVSASNPHQLLVLMVFTSVLMTGIAMIFLRNQLRPIRRLAYAAEEYGKGGSCLSPVRCGRAAQRGHRVPGHAQPAGAPERPAQADDVWNQPRPAHAADADEARAVDDRARHAA
ncbi:hypothetical protein FLP41_15000 [Paracoccus marcusii]|uniref:hypothetical protein n=1 Tax=Paracoccus marcusii TaxID=59779 RepID=UPI002ED4112A|nr:hypothetical protein FLP41_15000 [Paracoccus marcusii]